MIEVGDRVRVRATEGHGWWRVQVFEVSEDGRFAKVGTGMSRGQWSRAQWVRVDRLWKKR